MCNHLRLSWNNKLNRIIVLVLACFLGIGANVALASTDTVLLPAQQRLLHTYEERTQLIEQSNRYRERDLEQLQKRIEHLDTVPASVTAEQLDHANVMLQSARNELEAAKLALQQAMRGKTISEQLHDDIQAQPDLSRAQTRDAHQQLLHSRADRAFRERWQALRKQQLAALQVGINLAERKLRLAADWRNHLASQLEQVRRTQAIQQVTQLEHKLEQAQNYWLKQLSRLQDKKFQSTPLSAEATFELDNHIFYAGERSELAHMALLLQQLRVALQRSQQAQAKALRNIDGLTQVGHQVDDLLLQLQDLQQICIEKTNMIHERVQFVAEYKASNLLSANVYAGIMTWLNDLNAEVQNIYTDITALAKRTERMQTQVNQELHAALARRQGLPGFSSAAWLELGRQISHLPTLLVQASKTFLQQVHTAFRTVALRSLLIMVSVFAGAFVAWFILYRLLRVKLAQITAGERSFVTNALFIGVKLICRNLSWLILLASMFAIVALLGVPAAVWAPFSESLLVLATFVLAISFARLSLVENLADVTGQDVQFYQLLRAVLIIGGVITIGMVLTHHLPVNYIVRDFFNRIFMLFLFIVGLVLLRGWRIMPELIRLSIGEGRSYWLNITYLLSILIPSIILVCALIGILGYVDLAWTLGKYTSYFLLVLTAYLIVRAWITELAGVLAGVVIRRVPNGWLWSEALLKPLDKVLRIVLFFLGLWFLLFLIGVTRTSPVMQQLSASLNHPLFFMSEGNPFTLLSLIKLLIAVVILNWLARWTREFSYRFLYAGARDVGIRTSLSAFSQYTVVIVGIFVILKFIGVNLGDLRLVLGGLAVGIGFGLRDLANNFVCGILLLIERPVRAGDFVTIGEFEGEVTHIGLRSVKVNTWDHMEVLVPNSEIFSKPLTNWTHQDSIVRTKLSIKIDRRDDPHFVQHLIISVLKDIPEILDDPVPRAFLREINESLVEFQVNYYTNLQKQRSRLRVRSKVLLAIQDRFKASSIQPPYPHQSLHFINCTNS